MQKRLTLKLLLSAIVATGPLQPAQAQDKDRLVIGVSQSPTTVSPTSGGYFVLSMIYQTWEPLVARDAGDKLQPSLAQRWESLSPTRWRFHLRPGVKWHDGSPFTAEDVKFTLDYVTDPKTVYVRKGRIAGLKATTVIDPLTVEIETASPAPLLLRGLADIPIEQKAYTERVGREAAHRAPVGTGPWVYEKLVPNEYYDLTANPDYWGGAPKMKRLRIRGIAEGATRVASLMAGETHVIEEVPVDLLAQLKRRKDIRIAAAESSISLVLTLDTSRPPFNDLRVRQAVDYALNKPLMHEQMLAGYGSILDGQLVTRSTFGHNPNLKAREYDPAKARKLLAEAGYPNGFSTHINLMSGRYLSDIDIANATAGMMNAVGIRTTIRTLEPSAWSQMDRTHELGPVYMIGWFSVGDADFNTVWYTQASKRAYWKNEEFDRLWQQGRSTMDEQARLQAYHRMMQIMHDELPSVFLYGLPRIAALQSKVSGWTTTSDSLLRLKDVKVD